MPAMRLIVQVVCLATCLFTALTSIDVMGGGGNKSGSSSSSRSSTPLPSSTGLYSELNLEVNVTAVAAQRSLDSASSLVTNMGLSETDLDTHHQPQEGACNPEQQEVTTNETGDIVYCHRCQTNTRCQLLKNQEFNQCPKCTAARYIIRNKSRRIFTIQLEKGKPIPDQETIDALYKITESAYISANTGRCKIKSQKGTCVLSSKFKQDIPIFEPSFNTEHLPPDCENDDCSSGEETYQMPCYKHYFCPSCVATFVNNAPSLEVSVITCPDPECRTELTTQDVLHFTNDEDLYERSVRYCTGSTR